ncbi:MAG TPA: bifunctional DNA-formamidopyrimidine glycosylase/DNA-(apurinic or apyrimidinic site) lyase [Lichenihabitans sp.]|jgi:formamidopyrimidine-DNA glycosylase|nr:bifunctional DNA-formamidopyrimidine glycosylase/DNA-(apurinic or apyrimidinic site) lyase [Lichenihabitans sp.]
MPELPEVETVRRGLDLAMTGDRIRHVALARPDLRFPFPERFAARLEGRRIAAVGRRAKYLMIDLDDGALLAAHLGMTGSFRIAAPSREEAVPGRYHHARSPAGPHDHVRFEFESGLAITYNDPRRFGFMTLLRRDEIETHPLFRGIGIEPLGNEFDGHRLAQLLAGKAAPLKAALLDQRLIAGLGNIYVCEALHRAGLSPRREAGSIVRRDGAPTARAARLAETIRAVLSEAVEAGGSTLRDYRQADGALGTFQHGFRAYDREGQACMTAGCRGTIGRIVQSGRSTFFCAQCQR